jgi:Na+:H+ antiporter
MHEARFALQLALVVICAKLLGRVCQKYLKQPSVIGEIAAGIILGPFALGGFSFLGLGPLFPPGAHGEPISEGLRALAVVASVVLLFNAGLETNLSKFLRFALAGSITGLGGAVLCFTLGNLATVLLGGATGFTDPRALLMGVVATATSVGLTARVLSDKHKMDTPEGATILSAAVVDDVLGLVILGMVLAMTGGPAGEGASNGVPWGHMARLVLVAAGFWVVSLSAGVLLSRYLARFLKLFGSVEAAATGALGLALLLAGLAKQAEMELIIGAYIMGLSLSRTDLVHELERGLKPIYHLLVPIFFCVTGMMVDVTKIGSVLLFGMLFTAVCIVGKVIGCGLPALPLGFNLRGALRIGVGMMPRQEVALIVAGIALSRGVIGTDSMGAVILMVLVTAISAPPILARLFEGGSGRNREESGDAQEVLSFEIRLPSPMLAELVVEQMLKAFRDEEFYTYRLPVEEIAYELRKDEETVFIKIDGDRAIFHARPAAMRYARLVALEEMLNLEEIFGQASKLDGTDEVKRSLMSVLGSRIPNCVPSN